MTVVFAGFRRRHQYEKKIAMTSRSFESVLDMSIRSVPCVAKARSSA